MPFLRTPLKHSSLLASTAMKVVVIAALATMTSAGCGKDDNIQSDNLLEFVNVLPEKPVAMNSHKYEPWSSSRALAVRGDDLLVVDKDNGNLVVMNRESMTVSTTISLGNNPENVLVGPSGDAWVTVRGTGEVVHIGADNQIIKRIEIGNEPFGMAMDTAEARLYVTLSEQDAVVALAPRTLEVTSWMTTLDTPRGLALSSGRLHVVHQHDDAFSIALVNGELSDTSALSSVSLRRGIPSDHMGGRQLSTVHATRAIAATVHPQNGSVLVAHVQAQPGTDAQFLDDVMREGLPDVEPSSGGYGGSSASSSRAFNVPVRPVETSVSQVTASGTAATTYADHPVQDPKTGEPMTHLISQPSDINHHPTHTLALMTGYGSDQVLVLNTAASDPMLSPVGLVEVGWAPKAVTFSADGTRAYVLNHQALSVSEIDLTPFFEMKTSIKAPDLDAGGSFNGGMAQRFMESTDEDGNTDTFVPPAASYVRSLSTTKPLNLRARRTSSYGVDRRSAAVKRGQRVFTFSRNGNMSHAGQFACATCHFEGREDKLVWVIDDGPRQTPSLAGRLHDTGPFNWAGTKVELQGNMVQTVARMGGQGLEENEIKDLEKFLLSLPEVVNPNVRADGELNEEQAWGRDLFNRADVGCASCHSGSSFTDGRNHDVDTANKTERLVWEHRRDRGDVVAESPAILNTPTLRGLFYTAPYLHDGSAETLLDVLELAPNMGKPGLLSLEEKQAMVAYLLTL